MSRMNRDDALMLVKALHQELKPTGTRTALHHAYNPFFTYVVRETSYTLDSAHDWLVPGLFVAYDDIEKANRPNVVVIYKMGCGAILSLALPKLPDKKIPTYLTVFEKGKTFKGEPGVKIGIQHWSHVANQSDFTVKKGKTKSRHLARQSRRQPAEV